MASPRSDSSSGTYHKVRKRFFSNMNCLTGQDFSKADIRGIKWRNADLSQSKFCQAYVGLSPARIICLKASLIFLSLLIGMSAGLSSLFSTSLLSARSIDQYTQLPGIIVFILSLIGIVVPIIFGFLIAFTLDILVLFGLIAFSLLIQNDIWINFLISMGGAIVTQLVTLQAGGIISTVDRSLPRSLIPLLGTVALAGGIVFFSFMSEAIPNAKPNLLDYFLLGSCLLASAKIGWHAAKTKSPFPEIRRWAVAFAAMGGTSFNHADLTETDFSQTELKYADFRNANLTRAYWYSSKGLEFAQLGNTYLSNPKIRNLVVTLNGQRQNFDRLNLEGVNLKGANLSHASFAGTNLNHAILKNADLSGAILKQAQLDDVDLSGANLQGSILARASLTDANLSRADLTGACIKDWSFNARTQFADAVCNYVYREYKNNRPTDRYPPNRSFKPGEFQSLFQKLTNAVELVFNEQIDWPALSFAFEKFKIEDDGMGLELKGVEQRGDYWIVKVTHGEGVSKQRVEQQVQSTYEDLRVLMEAKDQEIHQLMGIVDSQAKTMGQQAEALTNFSKHPFGNSFFITGSTITNLAGSGEIEYQEAASIVRQLVKPIDDQASTLRRLIAQMSDQNIATTGEAQKDLIQQVLLSEADRDPRFKQLLLQQGQQIIESLPNREIAIAFQSAIAQLSK